MDLKTIEDIQDGMVVFMPSGIQATLYKDGDFIIVEYPEMYKDKYTKEMFNDIIKEGIIVFNKNTAKQSALMEAFENVKNPAGDVYTNIQNKENTQVTSEYKLKALTGLTKLAKEYPDVKVRQQALTFMDELGVQEYANLKEVDKFIDKYITELNKINKIEESLTEEKGEFAEDDAIQFIADNVEARITSGFEETKFGHWLLETSLDAKMETIDSDVKEFVFEKIAQPIYDGHLSYTDLQIYVSKDLGFSREQLETLTVFSPEDLNAIENGEEVCFYLTYEIKYDGNLEDEFGEAFKIKKKKNNKKKLAEDDGLGIYVKNTKTNKVEGPYLDKDTALDHIKQLVKSGEKEEDLILTNSEDDNMKDGKMQEAFRVYNTIGAEVVDAGTFNSWEVDAFLNKEWGSYCVDKCKQNPDFGSQEDKDNFLGNMEIEIVEVPCDDCCVEPECCDVEVVEEPVEVVEEPVESEELEEKELEEDFGEEGVEEQPEEKEEPEKEELEVENAEQAHDALEEIEDLVDNIEDYIKSLLDEEPVKEETPEEENITEMCMQKLPENATAKAHAYLKDCMAAGGYKTIEELKAEYSLDDMEQDFGKIEDEEVRKAAQNILDSKNEAFNDGMGMLTDINDLDFPDALQKVVDTKDDGSLYKIADVAKEIQTLKTDVQKQLDEIKDTIKTVLSDLKQDIKMEVNNVENKVQDTKSAVDNLTSEEEDLEAENLEEPMGEGPVEAPQGEPEVEEEPTEEKEPEKQEESFNNNLVVKHVKSIIENFNGKISRDELNEELTKVGFNTKLSTTEALVETALDDLKLRDKVTNTDKNESHLSMVKKYLKSGYLEDLDTAKKKVDQLANQGKSAEEIKNAITLLTDNEKDEKTAAEYAVSKIKETLQNSMSTSILGRLLKK